MRAMRILSVLVLAILATVTAGEPAWVAAMKEVHAKGGSDKGSVSQIGDSITYTKAFLAPLAWEVPAGFEVVASRVNRKQLNERKGPDHGNYSGWTATQGLGKLPGILASQKPEIAVIMYGTNEVTKGVAPADYEKNLTAIVDACLAAGCVPIISTIPPYPGKDDKAQALNAVVKKLATDKKIPLVDFYAAVLDQQPGTGWDGTLLKKGDVHPTGGKNLDFSAENLKVCGYALRNQVTLQVMKDVIEKCF
jgi:acyl-CoA thioesterase-1